MKRSGFKQKPYALRKPLKRTPFVVKQKVSPELKKRSLTKRKHPKERKLRIKLWELCKQITRLRYGNTCYTCLKLGLTGSSWQTGHFIPNAAGGASLRYNLDNLRVQCYRCNINLGGNGAIFYRNLVRDKGQAYVDSLFELKNQIIKADWVWLESKINEYEEIFKTESQPLQTTTGGSL